MTENVMDLDKVPSNKLEDAIDLCLRHQSGMTVEKFIQAYTMITRQFGCATQDGSLNEFEKELTIIIRRMLVAERFLRRLGFPADIRARLYAIEEAEATIIEMLEPEEEKPPERL